MSKANAGSLTTTGRIVRGERGLWQVRDEDNRAFACTLRGRLKGRALPVVGNLVAFLESGPSGVIEEVLPRRTTLARRLANGTEHVLAANVDQVVLVASARTPPFRPGAVERLLVYASLAGLEPALLLGKCDLVAPEEAADLLSPWRGAGFPLVPVSAITGEGLPQVRGLLMGKVSVLVGASGAGKSSLVNALCPDASARTGGVSEATSKGRHTTTSSRLYPLPFGGYLVDTPGVKELGLLGLEENDVLESFPEIAEAAARCRFRDCRHRDEKGCAVRAALAEGTIKRERFHRFQKMLAEL